MWIRPNSPFRRNDELDVAVLRNIKIRGSDVSDVQHAELKFYNSQTGVMVNVIQYIHAHTYFFQNIERCCWETGG